MRKAICPNGLRLREIVANSLSSMADFVSASFAGSLAPKANFMSEDSRVTCASLLLRIRQQDDEAAWREFSEIYVPLIYSYACKRGLQHADAADVVQDVLTNLNNAISGFDYQPSRGRFRSYLYTITRNQITKFRSRNAGKAGSGNSEIHRLLNQAEVPCDDEARWNEEHRWCLFDWATRKVESEFSDTTWQAFVLTALKSRKPAEVASQLEISVGAVYIARSRVIKRVRDVIRIAELES